jgi:hypothetical protein
MTLPNGKTRSAVMILYPNSLVIYKKQLWRKEWKLIADISILNPTLRFQDLDKKGISFF